MSGSCLGLRKACFLLSVSAAALLLLLLPRGQPPAAPRRRPPPVAGPSGPTPQRAGPGGSGVPGTRAGSRGEPGGGPGAGAGAGGRGGGLAGSPQPARKGRLGAAGGSGRESLELKDIFIAVKTTRKYHRSRLDLLLQTWISRARGQVRLRQDGQAGGRSLGPPVSRAAAVLSRWFFLACVKKGFPCETEEGRLTRVVRLNLPPKEFVVDGANCLQSGIGGPSRSGLLTFVWLWKILRDSKRSLVPMHPSRYCGLSSSAA